MLILLSDENKQHLSFLSSLQREVVAEFCKMAIGFMKKGINPKIYQSAASKLGISAEAVQNGILGLVQLLSESCKQQVSKIDFQDSITVLGLSDELNELLLDIYLKNKDEIRLLLSNMALDVPQYENLEWRFEVQVASRSCSDQIEPTIILKFHIRRGEQIETKLLQTDPVNLVHITTYLEKALQEGKSSYIRRIIRNI